MNETSSAQNNSFIQKKTVLPLKGNSAKAREKELCSNSINGFRLIEGLSFFELIQLKDAILFRLHKMDVSGKCSYCGENKKPNESWAYHWSRQCIKEGD